MNPSHCRFSHRKCLILAFVFCFISIASRSTAQSIAPPVVSSVTLNSGAKQQSDAALSPLSSNLSTPLFGTSSSKSQDPLPVEQAFFLTAKRTADKVSLSFTIAQNYYLYKDQIQVQSAPRGQIDMSALPKGTVLYDATFAKNLETYRGTLNLREIQTKVLLDRGLVLEVYSQGCADIGICYPPQLQKVVFESNQTQAKIITLDYVPREVGSQVQSTPNQLLNKTAEPSNQLTVDNSRAQTQSLAFQHSASSITKESNQIQALLANSDRIWMVIGFLGFGLLLTFTPCVLPMVPIVSAIVLGSNGGGGHSKAASKTTWFGFSLSLAYVLGMALVYTGIGVLAGLSGASLTVFLQHPVLISLFALLMVALAGSQFGWYALSLPQRFNPTIDISNPRSATHRYVGVMGMGALSAIMVGPCVTAPLAGALAFISQTGDAWKGGLALFSLAIGMGIPLLLIGAGGAKYLPKTGAWMNEMSHGFGIMLLAVAVWMIQSLVPIAVVTVLWIVLLVLLAEWLGALKFPTTMLTRFSRVKALFGYLCIFWAMATMAGMAAGRFDVMSPLSGFKVSAQVSTPKQGADFQWVPSSSLESAFKKNQGKPILLDIYADWCVSCIEFEKFTFTDTAVKSAMNQFHLLKVDVTQNTANDRELLKKLKLFGPPGIVFYEPNGQEIEGARVIGFKAATPFLQHLNQILSLK